jgi:hypothetical protein
MPVKTEIWRIDKGVEKVAFSAMEAEEKLESIIEKDIAIIDPDLMIIGRQVPTAYGTFIDLLAIDSEGHLALLELKKNKTPRDVIAQALDYASWIKDLTYEDIKNIYAHYETTREFETAFVDFFGGDPPESINEDHRLLVVAAQMDNCTERIVKYLSSNYGVPINVVFFQYFKEGQGEYLSRTWLIDPIQVEQQASKNVKFHNKEPWNGTDYYVSFGEGPTRTWDDAVKYGFISAGGGRWYSNTLSQLQPGGRIFVLIPKVGYVGVGIVKEEAVSVKDFLVDVEGNPTPILKLPYKAPDMGTHANDPDLSEYLVKVEWLKTFKKEQAKWEKGMFANRNSACRLRNSFTIERLTELFGLVEASHELQDLTFPIPVRAQHRGGTFHAELLNIEGCIRYENKEYETPTTAANAIITDWKEVNGWDFWRYLDAATGKWEKIGRLRKEP